MDTQRTRIPLKSRYAWSGLALLLLVGLAGWVVMRLSAAVPSPPDRPTVVERVTEGPRASANRVAPVGDLEEKTMEELLDLLTNPDPRVRAQATTTLIRRGEAAAGPLVDKLREIKASGRSSPATFHLEKALVGLGTAAAPALREARNEADEGVRACANRLLVQIGDAATLKALTAQLQQEKPEVREAAVRALIGGDYAAVGPAFTTLLRHKEAEVRQMAAWGLGRLKDERAVPALQKGLSDPEREVREKAAWALGYIGQPPAIAALLTALEAHEFELAEPILDDLRELQARPAVPRLVEWLRDERLPENVRRSMAYSLGRIGAAEARPALREQLAKKTLPFRYECAEALARLGDQSATPFLLEQLRVSDDRWQKMRLMQDLGRTGDQRALPALLEILQGKDELLQKRAADTLRQITGRDFGFFSKTSPEEQAQAVQRWLEWWNHGQPRQGPATPPDQAEVQAVCQEMLGYWSRDRAIMQDLGEVPVIALSTTNLPPGLRLSFPGKQTFLLNREEIRKQVEEWGRLPFIEFDFVRVAYGLAEVQGGFLVASPDGNHGLRGTEVLWVKEGNRWRLQQVLGSEVE